jgi:hypothetical protein
MRFALLTMMVQQFIYAAGTQKEGPPKRAVHYALTQQTRYQAVLP